MTLTSHLPPAAVPQALHNRVDLRLEHLGQLGAVLINARRLAVVEPGVVEHQPDVVHILPGLLVLARVKLPLYRGQVYWVLNDVKVVLQTEGGGGGQVPNQSAELCESMFCLCVACRRSADRDAQKHGVDWLSEGEGLGVLPVQRLQSGHQGLAQLLRLKD